MPRVSALIEQVPYRIEIKSATGNVVIADEPVGNGGKDTGFSPKELLTAALSACTSATLRMYADRKGWAIPAIKVETDLVESDGQATFSRKISFSGTLTEEQSKRLLQIANACPVHKILSGKIGFTTEII